MVKLLITFSLLVTNLVVYAKDGEFAVSRVPMQLLKNANAVMRLDELRFEIKSIREAVQTRRFVVTILNENGDHYAQFSDYYDKLRDITSIEGYLYDADGRQVKKVRSRDIQDVSGTSNISLAEDTRVKLHNFYYRSYPYTVEYIVEVKQKHTLYFPMWSPQPHEKLSVEKSSFTVVCPDDYSFRHKVYNYPGEPAQQLAKGEKITTWVVQDLTAYLYEPFQPELNEISTVVTIGPGDFQYGDYKGNMETWESFGRFLHELKKGRDVLPEHVKIKVHELTAGVTDAKEKVRILFEYMQQNTRYVSIQLGVGGWQPFDARYVAGNSYGDCKALSNYMQSLLKEAGIPSLYTLIRAGSDATRIAEDFPSSRFNHAILCVPFDKDSIWLECTSQTVSCGYMGSFTGNRFAFVTHENGGTLVPTPHYGVNENLQARKIFANLREDGSLDVSVNSRYYAMQHDEIHMVINNLSREKIKERLNKELDLATFEVVDFNYKEYKSALPFIDEFLKVEAQNFATITGKRVFFQPNFMTRTYARLRKDDTRKYDVVLKTAFREIDTLELQIPAGFVAETKTQDVSIDSRFGKYRNSVVIKENKLFLYRMMEQYEGRFPASEYNDLVDFYEKIYSADRAKLVFVKNESPLKAF